MIIKADILKHYNRMAAPDKTITAELLKNEYLGIWDLYKLPPENIVTGIDGGKWITKDREKTGAN